MKALLDVRGLTVDYPAGKGWLYAVRGVDFSLYEGQTLGIIGESGCGKSSLVRSLLRLTPPKARVTGQAWLGKFDLLSASQRELQTVRWRQMSFIPQSAMNSLDPVYRVGDQIVEVIQFHEGVSRKIAWQRAGDLLEMVGVPEERLNSFPHHLSGGTRQRVCIAMALALEPKILVADEPTTALDVMTQHKILLELQRLRESRHISLILISHDIAVVAGICDQVMVMYGGTVAEHGPVEQVLSQPSHPYTVGLIQSYPRLMGPRKLVTVPGRPPDLSTQVVGCVFQPRCPIATDQCLQQAPRLEAIAPNHYAACHYTGKPIVFGEDAWEDSSRQAKQEETLL